MFSDLKKISPFRFYFNMFCAVPFKSEEICHKRNTYRNQLLFINYMVDAVLHTIALT